MGFESRPGRALGWQLNNGSASMARCPEGAINPQHNVSYVVPKGLGSQCRTVAATAANTPIGRTHAGLGLACDHLSQRIMRSRSLGPS